MPATPWKPPFPVNDPALNRTNQSLSDALVVPWTHVFLITHDGTTSSAITSDMPNASATMQYRKSRDTTRMIFTLQYGGYGVANSVVEMYVSNTGVSNGYVSTDPAIAHFYHNVLDTHAGFGG